MATIHLVTTAQEYTLPIRAGESVLEALRRHNVPLQCTLLLDDNQALVSLTATPAEGDKVTAYSLRNADFRCILPHYQVLAQADAVTELIRPLQNPRSLGIIQYSRESAMQYVMDCVTECLDAYAARKNKQSLRLQVALSPGGDGRILAECLRQYWDRHPDLDLHCVIVAVGFEDEGEHLGNGIALARQFDLPYTALNVEDAARTLGLRDNLKVLSDEFRNTFPEDEPEVMLTYWVQQVNAGIARRDARDAVLFGYNQEDVIAERLYQALTGRFLPAYPIRADGDLDYIAPLFQVPKKMLDSMDIGNSLRNYRIRTPSVSYLRSSLYLLAYLIVEQTIRTRLCVGSTKRVCSQTATASSLRQGCSLSVSTMV